MCPRILLGFPASIMHFLMVFEALSTDITVLLPDSRPRLMREAEFLLSFPALFLIPDSNVVL